MNRKNTSCIFKKLILFFCSFKKKEMSKFIIRGNSHGISSIQYQNQNQHQFHSIAGAPRLLVYNVAPMAPTPMQIAPMQVPMQMAPMAPMVPRRPQTVIYNFAPAPALNLVPPEPMEPSEAPSTAGPIGPTGPGPSPPSPPSPPPPPTPTPEPAPTPAPAPEPTPAPTPTPAPAACKPPTPYWNGSVCVQCTEHGHCVSGIELCIAGKCVVKKSPQCSPY